MLRTRQQNVHQHQLAPVNTNFARTNRATGNGGISLRDVVRQQQERDSLAFQAQAATTAAAASATAPLPRVAVARPLSPLVVGQDQLNNQPPVGDGVDLNGGAQDMSINYRMGMFVPVGDDGEIIQNDNNNNRNIFLHTILNQRIRNRTRRFLLNMQNTLNYFYGVGVGGNLNNNNNNNNNNNDNQNNNQINTIRRVRMINLRNLQRINLDSIQITPTQLAEGDVNVAATATSATTSVTSTASNIVTPTVVNSSPPSPTTSIGLVPVAATTASTTAPGDDSGATDTRTTYQRNYEENNFIFPIEVANTAATVQPPTTTVTVEPSIIDSANNTGDYSAQLIASVESKQNSCNKSSSNNCNCSSSNSNSSNCNNCKKEDEIIPSSQTQMERVGSDSGYGDQMMISDGGSSSLDGKLLNDNNVSHAVGSGSSSKSSSGGVDGGGDDDVEFVVVGGDDERKNLVEQENIRLD